MAEPPETDADIAAMSFETALEALNSLVQKLESGEAPLEDAIATYARGVKLKQHCEAKLRDAQMRIDQIRLAPDGSVTTDPLDP